MLDTTLHSLENILKYRSVSASCACQLHEYHLQSESCEPRCGHPCCVNIDQAVSW